jgi:thermostable 8-oxoguanine DNA glycosylase
MGRLESDVCESDEEGARRKMITAEQIASVSLSGSDYDETERLKAEFARLRHTRQPLYLTRSEFEKILKWKLDRQLGRQRKIRAVNTEEVISAVTCLAFTITHEDKVYESELRIKLLCALRGVGIPVASAILAIVFPEEYAVIDVKVWHQLFNENRTAFSISNYRKYMHEIRRLSNELGWPPQKVDFAIWLSVKKPDEE